MNYDETQFFDDLSDFDCKVANHDCKIVIVVDLDGDYLGYFGKSSHSLYEFGIVFFKIVSYSKRN